MRVAACCFENKIMAEHTLKPSSLRTPPGVIVSIVAVSAAASALICWLVYFHTPTDVAHHQLRSLPLVNAVLNALATVALLTGFYEIRERRVLHHRASMFGAFFFSSIFLVSYLVNFTLHGETRFNRFNHWWPFYWKLLASHIVLSTIALPLILITFFLSLTGRFPAHRRLARWTFPIWLYVSVTGVIVYLMQAACR
jgi:putative membrane protein